MKKMFIDYEWGVEFPLMNEDGSYVKKKDLKKLELDLELEKKIHLWAFAIQNEMNWHNPNDSKKYLPSYYYDFIQRIEQDIIKEFKKYKISLIKS